MMAILHVEAQLCICHEISIRNIGLFFLHFFKVSLLYGHRFGNTAYLHISVAFIQMLKALSMCEDVHFFFPLSIMLILLILVNDYSSSNFGLPVPVATFIMAVMCGTDKPRCDVFLNMLLVSVGVVISSYGEIHFNVVGTVYQVTGIFAEALRLVLTQVLLQKKGLTLNPITSLYYIAPCRYVF